MTATLTDGQSLLRAVIADPDDTAVRLIFADWLEENGEGERAEFIRVQCELARFAGIFPAPRYGPDGREADLPGTALRRRERELLSRHEEEWLGPEFVSALHLATYEGPPTWQWFRGFVESVSLSCADGLAHGPRLVRLAPLREVRLTDKYPQRYEFRQNLHPEPYYRWFDGSRRGEPNPPDADPDELPFCLWNEYARLMDRAGLSWEHPTEADAREWLSKAFLSWARSQGA